MARFDEQPYVDPDSWRWIAAVSIHLAYFAVGMFLAVQVGEVTGSFRVTIFAGVLIVFASHPLFKARFILKWLGWDRDDVDPNVDPSEEQPWWDRATRWAYLVSMPFFAWFFYSNALRSFESQGPMIIVVIAGVWIGIFSRAVFFEIRSAILRRRQVQS